MLWVQEKDITTVTEGIIVHGVNCQGAMGSGVAKAIRTKWPEVYEGYRQYYETYLLNVPLGYKFQSEVLLGEISIVQINDKLFVINAFIQDRYGHDGKKYISYDAVDSAFGKIAEWAEGEPVRTLELYFPKIGSGLGGGRWEIVKAIIVSHFSRDRDLMCCEY